MTSLISWRRFLAASLLIIAETVAVVAISTALVAPARAQFFGDRFEIFPDMNRRRFQPFEPRRDAPPPDNSKAPPPKRAEAAPETQIVVIGDSNADWLAYGLESAFADSPELGVLRKHRANSGLIRNDIKSELPDWPQLAREIINAEKASIVVVMIGLHDRQSIRERAPVPAKTPAAPAGQAAPQGQAAQQGQPPAQQGQPAQQQQAQQPAQQQQAATPPAPPAAANTDAEGGESLTVAQPEPRGATIGTHEFRSEKWVELYGKRIDDTINAAKAKGAAVIWVGLPPIRGARSTSDAIFLNDMYRSRAEKNGAVYVDVWDGFADEGGRFTTMGPDFEGQIRRLRSADGVHYTQAGARKLAHFVEREVRRVLASRTGPIAIPVPQDQPVQQPAQLPGTPMARPQAGPVMPLTAAIGTQEDLLGGGPARQNPNDAIASRVLVKGEPMPAPAGRADDFAWPRRGVAPVGADPIATTTTLPMTPMVAQPPQQPEQKNTATAARVDPNVRQLGPPGPGGPRGFANTGQFRPPGGIHQQRQQQQQAQQQQQQRGNSFFFLFSPR